jgi:hypothetical protein
MRLSKDRFYRSDYRIDRGKGAEVFPLYTYETSNALYDITTIDGMKFYRVNMGQWSNTSEKPIHYEIEKYFHI